MPQSENTRRDFNRVSSLRRLTLKNSFTIFCYPNQVKFDIIRCMAGLTIMLHAKRILKSSPEGEGFSPIPRMGHKIGSHVLGSAQHFHNLIP